MHEDSNELYPSMVARHQMILKCSIIMQQIIHSFEIDTSGLLNILKLLILIKWLIYRNYYLAFYNKKWIRQEIFVICKCLYKSRKKFGYFHYLLNKHKIFHLFELCLQGFMENSCTAHPAVIVFMVRGGYGIKWHFQHLSTGRTY